MTPEVQQYLLAGFLLLAAVFAVPLLKRVLTPVKKRISDRIPTLVEHLLRCFLRPAAWLVRVTLAGWAVLTIPWSAEIRALLSRAMPYYHAFVLAMAAWGVWEAIPVIWQMLHRHPHPDQPDNYETLSRFFENGCRTVVVVMAVLVGLDGLGVPVTSLIAGAGVVGLAITLAAQSTLSSLIAGITLVAEHPFALGDYIVLGDVEGTVEDISLRSTRIRTPDQVLITVENSKVCAEYIQNANARTQRLWAFTIALEYRTSAPQVEQFIRDLTKLLVSDPEVDGQSVQAVLEEFADSSINVNVRMMVNTPGYGDYRALKGKINLAVMHLMAEEGLSFAFPSRSVYVEKNAQ